MKKHFPKNRSQMMAAVHSKNTKPELLVRRALFKFGFRYRLHRRDLPGTPDLFVLRYGVAIFVNGCFWHQHGCKFTTHPKSNIGFWNNKFEGNMVRDIKIQRELSLKGIRVATIWECSLAGVGLVRDPEPKNIGFERVIERLVAFIKGDEETIEI